MKRITLLLAFLFIYGFGIAQSKILVNVLDSLTNEPIAYASITIGKSGGLTDDYGQAYIKLESIKISDTLYISRVGYKSNKVFVTNQITSYTIKLVQADVKLKEVSIIGFTDAELIDRLLTAYKNTMQSNKSFAAFLNTYTIKENNEPVEHISGAYNFIFSGPKLNTIELKHGDVVFPKEELNKNFLSIGITKLYILLNPFGLNTSKQFESPYRMPKSKTLDGYKLGYERLEEDRISINFISKNKLNNGYAVIRLDSLKLEEVSMTWRFLENYPIVSINENASISDTMVISSNTYFKNAKFTNQLLRFDFVYNKESMKTRSIGSFVDSIPYDLPINSIEYNNDYFNILSRPAISASLNLFENDKKNIGRLDSIFNIGIEETTLLSSPQLSNEVKSEFTEISFFNEEWTLDWGKIMNGNPEKPMDSKIKTIIYADKIIYEDSVIFIIEPIFDYARTTYNYERDAKAASFISNYFYLTKIQCDLLYKELINSRVSSYASFKEIVKQHEEVLRKRQWKYKFDTNGGNNEQEMNRWNNLIYTELNE